MGGHFKRSLYAVRTKKRPDLAILRTPLYGLYDSLANVREAIPMPDKLASMTVHSSCIGGYSSAPVWLWYVELPPPDTGMLVRSIVPVSCSVCCAASVPMVHFAIFVLSSYNTVPCETCRFAVRTILGNGSVTTTFSTVAELLLPPGKSSEEVLLAPTRMVTLPLLLVKS